MIKVIDLKKDYKPKKGAMVTALDGVNLDFADKGLVFLLGKSGSGKSTLLNLLGGLDSYTSGDIVIKGKSTKDFNQSNFDSYRNTLIGFIFQEFNILEEYSVGKNIGLALELQHRKADKTAIIEMLTKVELEEYFDRKPNELSGGQKQRIAIARALIKNPDIIMADEPTGALDSNTGKQVFDTLKKLAEEKLVIVVSHDRENAELYANRIIELADGKVISDRIRSVETGELVAQPLMVVDEKLIRIKAGKALSEDDINSLNDALSKSTDDVFISFDGKSNIEFSKKSSMLGTGQSTFTDTTADSVEVKQYDPNQFKMTKSRLPVKDSFKMGASSLGHKKFRLIVSIFLSFLTFTMVGFCVSASLFDAHKVEFQTAVDSKLSHITISSKLLYNEGYMVGTNSPGFTDDQLAKLEQLTGKKGMPFYVADGNSGYYNNNYNIANFKNMTQSSERYVYYQMAFKNLLIVKNESDVGLTPLGNSRLPVASNEIAITDYTADSFIHYGYTYGSGSEKITEDITEATQLIGKKIILVNSGNQEGFVITGVYKTQIDKSQFDEYKTKRVVNYFSEMIFSAKDMLLGMAFVGENFTFEESASVEGENYKLKNGNMEVSSLFMQNPIRLNEILRKGNDETIMGANGEIASLEKHQIAISNDYLRNSLYIEPEELLAWTADERTVSIRYTLGLEPIKVEIVGSFDSTGRSRNLIFSDQIFEMILNQDKENKEIQYNGYLGNNDASDILIHYVQNIKRLGGVGIDSNAIYWGKTNGVENKARRLADDEIIIAPYNLIDGKSQWSGEDVIEAFDNLATREIYLSKQNDGSIIVGGKKLKIVGVDCGGGNNIIVSDKEHKEQLIVSSRPKTLLFAMPQGYAAQQELINYIKEQKNRPEGMSGVYEILTIGTHIDDVIDTAISFVSTLTMIFKYASIALSIFAALLMMNFITTSISYKKKEIGVLRAIGARSSDVFKIFFAESSIIALINIVLASITLVAASIAVNNWLNISVLVFTPWAYLAMAGLCILIAFVATVIPTIKIAKKKPIDAINNK